MSGGDSRDPLDALGRRLEAAQRRRDEETGAGKPSGSAGGGRGAPGIGRVGLELIVAAVAGLLLGVGFDRWFGTKPVGLLVFFALGIAAGMLNVWRAVMGMGQAVGLRKKGDDQAGRTGNEDRPRDED
ncbi:MAG TPA: AtpZ/AtpI family protein [Stellaceae bacterium]|nr:AtpZ/AtpI family protein [Stellaceae bacterium]